jgi:hypothetical protein
MVGGGLLANRRRGFKLGVYGTTPPHLRWWGRLRWGGCARAPFCRGQTSTCQNRTLRTNINHSLISRHLLSTPDFPHLLQLFKFASALHFPSPENHLSGFFPPSSLHSPSGVYCAPTRFLFCRAQQQQRSYIYLKVSFFSLG